MSRAQRIWHPTPHHHLWLPNNLAKNYKKNNEENTSKILFTCLIKEFYLNGTINFTFTKIPLLHHLFPLVLNSEGAHTQIFHLEGPVFLQLKLIFSLLNTENRIKQQEPARAGADGRGMHGDVDNNTHTVDHTPFQSAQRGHMFTKQNKSSRLELSLVLAATIWTSSETIRI